MRESNTPNDRAALRWLFGFVHPHRWRLALVVLVALISTALVLLQPLLTKFLIDDGILAGDFRTVVLVCSAMLAVALLGVLLGGLNRYQHVGVSADILFALRLALFRHLQRLPPTFYARWRSGDLLTRLDGDVAEIQRFAVDALLAAVSATIGLIGALALMVMLSSKRAPMPWYSARRSRSPSSPSVTVSPGEPARGPAPVSTLMPGTMPRLERTSASGLPSELF